MPCACHPEVVQGLVPCDRCEQRFCPDCVVEILGVICCAPCKAEQVRDMQSDADSLNLALATPGRRLAAFLLDGALLLVPLVAGASLLESFFRSLSPRSDTLPLIVTGLGYAWLSVGYEGVLLAWRGQTLGKRLAGIKVVSADGGDVGAGQAWGRALTRALLSILWVDYLPAFFTEQRVCLHDLAARTRVIRWDP